MVFYSYGHLLVITGYFNGNYTDYTFYKCGFVSTYNWYNSGHNCIMSSFCTSKTPSKIYQQNSVEHVELRAYEKVQHQQDGNRIAKVLKFKSHRGLGRVVQMPLLVERDVAMFFATNMEGTIDN